MAAMAKLVACMALVGAASAHLHVRAPRVRRSGVLPTWLAEPAAAQSAAAQPAADGTQTTWAQLAFAQCTLNKGPMGLEGLKVGRGVGFWASDVPVVFSECANGAMTADDKAYPAAYGGYASDDESVRCKSGYSSHAGCVCIKVDVTGTNLLRPFLRLDTIGSCSLTGNVQVMNKKKKAYEVKSEKKTLSRSDYLQLVIDKLNACRHSPTSANSRTSTTTSSSDNILAKNSGAVDSSRHSSTASAASDNILAKTGAGEINNHHPSIVSSTSSSGDNILVDSNNILRNKVAPPSSANGIANGNANLQHQCDYRDEPFLQELLAGTAPWTVVNRHAFVPIPAYGLGNPQYRCFMNSVMQVLARAPALVAAVHDAATQYQQETSAHAKLLRELDKHMSGSGLVGSKSDAMTSFITSFQKAMEASKLAGSNTFDGNTQHDASDFVQKLLSLAAYVGNNNDLNHQSSLYKKEVPNVVLKTAVSTSTMIVQKKTKQCEDPEASAQKSCIYDMSTNIMLSLYDHDAKTNKKFTNVEDSVKAYLFAKSRYGGMTDLCTKAVKSGDGPYASEEKTVERWPSTLIIEVKRENPLNNNFDTTTKFVPNALLKPNIGNPQMAYQLVGAVLYDGSINPNNGEWQGHYTAVVACNAGRTKWQTISDNVVGQCGSISSRVNTHARVLLYSMAP